MPHIRIQHVHWQLECGQPEAAWIPLRVHIVQFRMASLTTAAAVERQSDTASVQGRSDRRLPPLQQPHSLELGQFRAADAHWQSLGRTWRRVFKLSLWNGLGGDLAGLSESEHEDRPCRGLRGRALTEVPTAAPSHRSLQYAQPLAVAVGAPTARSTG